MTQETFLFTLEMWTPGQKILDKKTEKKMLKIAKKIIAEI